VAHRRVSGPAERCLLQIRSTSTGERYLPFEYHGAVSRWCIEVPPETNYIDLDTMIDTVLHLSYTARRGGPALREAAAQTTHHRLPGDGSRLFHAQTDFGDAWAALRSHRSENDAVRDRSRRLGLRFTTSMSPFILGRSTRYVHQLLVVVDADATGDHHVLRMHLLGGRPGHEARRHAEAVFVSDSNAAGVIDLADDPLGPIDERRAAESSLYLPASFGHVRRIFIIARHTTAARGQA
jgi:hypothetical protein